jgi:hypothetical protein
MMGCRPIHTVDFQPAITDLAVAEGHGGTPKDSEPNMAEAAIERRSGSLTWRAREAFAAIGHSACS